MMHSILYNNDELVPSQQRRAGWPSSSLNDRERSHKALFSAPLCGLHSPTVSFLAVQPILSLLIVGCCEPNPPDRQMHPLPPLILGIQEVAQKESLWLGLPPWVVKVMK